MPNDPGHRTRQDAIARMVEQERRELENATVIPVIVGPVLRCHHCGEASDQLYALPWADHPDGQQLLPKQLCRNCHPEARKAYWKHEGKHDAASDQPVEHPFRSV